ncbi:flagellar biosynthesis protein FlgD [Burkholderia sp. WAC0059]|nr:flagellar biosynthesis protein FlgD [Burkholderia sp. WAC0059]
MNGTNSSTSSSSSTSSTSDLQSTFLQLLVTQLQNQDPTSPMDSSQMTSQLAQIETVTGVNQLNTSLQSLSTQLNATQEASSASLIGSTVLAPGSEISVTSGNDIAFGVKLANAATNVQVLVENSSGQIVGTDNLGSLSAGTTPVVWSPVDSSGNALPSGTYKLVATGTINGETATATTLTPAIVDAIVQQSNGTAGALLSNNDTVSLTSLGAILSAGSSNSGSGSGSDSGSSGSAS